MTLNDLLDRWQARKRETLSFKAAENIARMVRRWKGVVGGLSPAALTPFQVQEIEKKAADGRSAAAVNSERMWFRQFVVYMMDLGVIDRDVTKGWKKRGEVKKRRTVRLGKEDVERIALCCEPWLGRFVRFAFATGLREGTIRKLTWGMVREDWVLHAPGEVLKQRKPLTVPLGKEAVAALGRRGSVGALLFPGLPAEDVVYRGFRAAVKRAGVDSGACVHSLRASFAMRLLENGAPLPVVMQLGGWSSAATLINHYYVGVGRDVAERYLEEP